MTLDDVVNEFETRFAGVVKDANAPFTVVLCSGAIGLVGHPPPVICSTEALAVELWRRTALDYALETAGVPEEILARFQLVWAVEPRVMRFEMTIRDKTGGHRVATTRYAVYSLCAIVEKPQDVVAEPTGSAEHVPARRAARARQGKRGKAARDQHQDPEPVPETPVLRD